MTALIMDVTPNNSSGCSAESTTTNFVAVAETRAEDVRIAGNNSNMKRAAVEQRGQKRGRQARPADLPSATEWQSLIADMGTVHLRDSVRQKPQGVRYRRGKQTLLLARTRESPHENKTAATIHQQCQASPLDRNNYECYKSSNKYYSNDFGQHGSPSSDGRLQLREEDDDDDELALGPPPLFPPKLKRARACSYSGPNTTTTSRGRIFSEGIITPPRQ